MSIDMTITEQGGVIYARPPHGKPIAFSVEYREVKVSASRYDNRRACRWIVGLTGNPAVEFSRHMDEETAQRAALRRANKYDRAYSVPRGLAAVA